MSHFPENAWLCACFKCQAARNQLQRCLLKREREARSQRVAAKLIEQMPKEYPDHIVEKGVGLVLRQCEQEGLPPVSPTYIQFALDLADDGIDRIDAALRKFVEKGWVIEVKHPKASLNPEIHYKLAK